MVVLLVAVLGLIVATALAFWPSRAGAAPAGTGGVPPCPGHAGAPEPTSLEGVLAAQVVAGGITRIQYVRALEQIAARDEQRHPLDVPWDARP